MRCQNIITSGKCSYGVKCLYAHSLAEQKVEGIRKVAMDIILKRPDLSDIDLSTNKKLYSHLKCMSNMCPKCKDGKCTGGYNCKHGACDPGYVVCLEDINKGTCRGNCGKIHLTNRGLIPYGVRIVNNTTHPILRGRIKPVIIDEDFFKNNPERVNRIKKGVDAASNKNNSEVSPNDSAKIDMNNGISAMEIFLSGDARRDTDTDGDDSEDPLMSFINSDYLIESELAKQDAKKADPQNEGEEIVDIIDLNLISVADSSSDSLSLSSEDDSEDIADMLLFNSDTTKLERSIFGIPLLNV